MLKCIAQKMLLFVLVALLVVACSQTEKKLMGEHVNIDAPEILYHEAMQHMDKEAYSKAVDSFEELEMLHPFSVWATRGQVMQAYAHYNLMKYDDAVSVLERFIRIHPGNDSIEYAYYLRALCYFRQITDIHRDQETTKKALIALKEVIGRFPGGEYTQDAQTKLEIVANQLAAKEMEIGRYYLKQGLYVAALKRFNEVIESYSMTVHVPEALLRLAETYASLGIMEEVKRCADLLHHNYPNTTWAEYSEALL